LACGFAVVVGFLRIWASRDTRRRGRLERFGYSHAAAALVLVLVIGSLITDGAQLSTRGAVMMRGQLSLMTEYEGDRSWAFAYAQSRRTSQDEVLSTATLSLRPTGDRLDGGEPPILAGPFSVPPGRYEARLWFEGNRPRHGEAFTAAAPQVHLAEARDRL